MFKIENNSIVYENISIDNSFELNQSLKHAFELYQNNILISTIKFLNCNFIERQNFISFDNCNKSFLCIVIKQCNIEANQALYFTNCSYKGTLQINTDNDLAIQSSNLNQLQIMLEKDVTLIDVMAFNISNLRIEGQQHYFVKKINISQDSFMNFISTNEEKTEIKEYECLIKNLDIGQIDYTVNENLLNKIKLEKLNFIDDEASRFQINSWRFKNDIEFDLNNVTINSKFNFNNLKIQNSHFENINFSKLAFNNSTIKSSKVIGCQFEEEKDYEIRQVYAILFIFLIITLILASIFKPSLLSSTNSSTAVIEAIKVFYKYIFGLLMVLSFVSIPFIFFKHKKIADENINFTIFHALYIEFVYPIKIKISQLFPTQFKFDQELIYKSSKDIKNYYARLEENYRVLKNLFSENNDLHMKNEFLYSESLMKIKQQTFFYDFFKSIFFLLRKDLLKSNIHFKNIVFFNLDFYSYLLNGFGRRWKRAFLNLVIFFFICQNFLVDIRDFTSTKETPAFLLKMIDSLNYQTKGFSLITSMQAKENIIELFLLSRLDLLKTGSGKWFEYTSYGAFVKYSILTMIFMLLTSSLLIALKRRFEK